MSLFLSQSELEDMTDRTSVRYQVAWLKDHGYPFELSALGKPKVLRAYVQQRLGLAIAEPLKHTEPDFSSWTR